MSETANVTFGGPVTVKMPISISISPLFLLGNLFVAMHAWRNKIKMITISSIVTRQEN